MKRIALVSDAWAPQVNGVVRTLMTTVKLVQARGYEVLLITPDRFATIACPGYSEIRLAVAPGRQIRRELAAFDPDIVHITTEGPLGWAARAVCKSSNLPFTTAYHTRFPEYLSVRTGLPAAVFWPAIRRFHSAAQLVMAATPALKNELEAQGLGPVHLWSRGVDCTLFVQKGPRLPALNELAGPVMLSVGRVAVEKNIEAFLNLDVPGTKVVVGDGPALTRLRQQYPDVIFTGALHGEALAAAYRSADVFVFPSRTDTFGLVMVEALASGLPVAAFPVNGPLDVISQDRRVGAPATQASPDILARGPVGALHADLGQAITNALNCKAEDCVAYAQGFSWAKSVDQFIDGLHGAYASASNGRRQSLGSGEYSVR